MDGFFAGTEDLKEFLRPEMHNFVLGMSLVNRKFLVGVSVTLAISQILVAVHVSLCS